MDEPPSQSLLDWLSGIHPIIWLGVALIFLLLFLSGMVSASEVAFFSLKPDDLERCRKRNNRSDRNIIDLLGNPRLLLATILIANNTVNVGVVTVATFLMWELANTRRPEEFIVAGVTLTVTLLITFFGEILPKVYATKNNFSLATRLAGTWKALVWLFRPLSIPLMRLTRWVEKRFEKKGYQATVQELHQALEIATQAEPTSQEEKKILKGIVSFGTITVRQIMRSRVDIAAVDIEKNFHELLDDINRFGFSRMPAYRETIDKIEGILYIKDLLPYLHEDASFNWQKLLRPGFFVPETKKIDTLLKDFQEKHVHMAVVVDEYGGTAGLVTLEDVLEEIIGEINDEFDEATLNYQRMDDRTFIFEGNISLHDLCKALNLPPETFDEVRGESESLGGLMLELHRGFPKAGEHIHYKDFEFVIETVDKKRIRRIKVILPQKSSAQA
ncbi:MAG: gliding motility-associated protein GldE [Cyclobacteriaceae bacterium]|nr:gliding motility-associated protein GldE [Cyclobacteriaceae bacterium]MDW8330800.1 gliding motility-associated protein GldE [Cyclobacteriaceae bacterium]